MSQTQLVASLTMNLCLVDGGDRLKKMHFLNNMSALHKRIKPHSGLTLLELIVTIAISTIIMVALTSIVTMTYKSFNMNTNDANAQNLAVLTVQKIQNETRNCTALNIYSYNNATGVTTPSTAPSATLLFYDSKNSGISIGGTVYLKGIFKNYNCVLTFTGTGTELLGLEVQIYDNNNKLLYQSSTSIYLNNQKTITVASGNAIAFTPQSS